MRTHLFLYSLLLASSVGAQDNERPKPGLTVRTSSGTYTGFINSSAPDVNQWLGIRFGQPPVGAKRFMPPEKAPFAGPADAKTYKPICYQNSGAKTSLYWELLPEYLNMDTQSEDCLFLNLWAPRKPVQKKVPVIIWVVGGGFKEGGGHALYQVPDKWIQRMQTHIVVTFNYRLHIFGFPGSPAASKNVGLMDVRLLVEWVKENIEGFGGDPDRMIMWGQSAGSGIVLMYSYANPQTPLVRGFICASSGTPVSNPTNSSNFHDLAQLAGCANLTATEELACMQKVDALVLNQKVDQYNPDPNRGVFRPIADNITAFTNTTERLEKGLVAKLPLIGGFNYNEAAVFLPFDPTATTAPPVVPVPGAAGLMCSIKQEIDKRNLHGMRGYRYLYAGNFSNVTPRYWYGGMHSSELPQVFGTHYEFRGNSTEFEWQTSFAMEAFWVSFATDPDADPHYNNKIWPQYVGPRGEIVIFGNTTYGPSYVGPVAVADYFSGPCL